MLETTLYNNSYAHAKYARTKHMRMLSMRL